MPAQVLKSLASKAGKALGVAERYWKEAKESVSKLPKKPTNEYAYIVGVVKKRLGLESIDLVLCGVDPAMLLEEFVGRITPCRSDDFDRALQCIALSELIKAQNGEQSSIAILGENGHSSLRRSFIAKIERIEERFTMEQLRSLFPGVADRYLQVLAESKVASKCNADNPGAVAASMGRKKDGKDKFQKAVGKGKKLKESIGFGLTAEPVDEDS